MMIPVARTIDVVMLHFTNRAVCPR